MNNKIIINNQIIANYVMFKLNKLTNEFSIEELNEITELIVDFSEEENDGLSTLNELLNFHNIKAVTLRNLYVFNHSYNIFLQLPNLSEIVFDNCEFENADLIASLKLKALSLINCKINNYSFVNIFKDLEQLTIINGDVEINRINFLKNLNYLQLSYSNILDNTELNIKGLSDLYIDNTNIDNLEFLTNLVNLKKLGIDKKQYDHNKEMIQYLQFKNILVLNEGIVMFGGESNET